MREAPGREHTLFLAALSVKGDTRRGVAICRDAVRLAASE